jgi:hypothetical protein
MEQDMSQELSDEQLWSIWNAQGSDDMSKSEAFIFARAVIAADRAKRVPMTQLEVVEAFCKLPHDVQYVSVFDAGIRAAEAFHGIGSKT